MGSPDYSKILVLDSGDRLRSYSIYANFEGNFLQLVISEKHGHLPWHVTERVKLVHKPSKNKREPTHQEKQEQLREKVLEGESYPRWQGL